ncbi:hypothetical protein D8B26_001050 [Coccidioides posadasii str. Silveira]|uniref:Uncharacterized protein n=2 Tax=Coccidioides posadasii TaxID=199306 RepID=A0A0J6EUM5_COCPO|nr:hypothetical protein CPC735_039380 [Coccidioides posadasii C735 delta SOWgp]EER28673.1 hypothetical protein CPC735_039380 [Coccidioides posadasii C735 delta SOWgp]KMM64226.1 hypothetical protein CPAG_00577 [Coccidioides posadasii RMSCC 3488]QVM06338.1 hypothetical protein D8B26_001050 [Coccidioides posadasii str. Silveira]|eukprot:XP_003070818.1 hypothetical protein CPC735_039380 [Coccidioides posadasii C735 delta SOWgp]
MAAVGRAELHGQKRRADDELEGEQPLTKRFGRLRIGRVLGAPDAAGHVATPAAHPAALPTARRACKFNEDGMQIDDTKTRVYINDLESEIAEIEAEEKDHAIEFLPEIEKKLMAIPKSVLNPKPDNELVLYRIPRSLSIPEEEDRVRSVIADARGRAREKSLADAKEAEEEEETNSSGLDDTCIHATPWRNIHTNEPDDPLYDAMEID